MYNTKLIENYNKYNVRDNSRGKSAYGIILGTFSYGIITNRKKQL